MGRSKRFRIIDIGEKDYHYMKRDRLEGREIEGDNVMQAPDGSYAGPFKFVDSGASIFFLHVQLEEVKDGVTSTSNSPEQEA